MEVLFHETADDELLKFAVIAAKYKGKFVYCKHRSRSTYELPGGHREKGETIEETARREFFEETGAKEYTLIPVCVYSVKNGEKESFGMLYYAAVTKMGNKPDSEIERVLFLDDHPANQTYPEIQPRLIKEIVRRGICS